MSEYENREGISQRVYTFINDIGTVKVREPRAALATGIEVFVEDRGLIDGDIELHQREYGDNIIVRFHYDDGKYMMLSFPQEVFLDLHKKSEGFLKETYSKDED